MWRCREAELRGRKWYGGAENIYEVQRSCIKGRECVWRCIEAVLRAENVG